MMALAGAQGVNCKIGDNERRFSRGGHDHHFQEAVIDNKGIIWSESD